MNNLYETGEGPKHFNDVTIIVLMKKLTATKCRDYRAISLIAHAARTLRTRTKRKMEDVIEEDGLHLEEDKELRLQLGC
jgi:hypothetical protein